MFYAPWFVIAGLAAAAGPVIIHLLNRQRYRVVEWAAMDFLLESQKRNKKWIVLKQLLLLLLRTLAIAAAVLMLAGIGVQTAKGYTNYEPALYLKALFGVELVDYWLV